MKKILSVMILISICTWLTSCATMINGRRQLITVTSDPIGATISDGRGTWTTPAVIPFERKQTHLLTISKPGYQSESVQLHRVLSGAVAVNLLNPVPGGALIGWGIDAMTGAQYRIVPETVNVKLKPLAPNALMSDHVSMLK